MSHFVLLTVGVTPEHLDEALAPFYEQTEDPAYLEFRETESEYKVEYETESVEMVRLADGALKYRWDKEFKLGTFPKETTVYPEGSQLELVTFKELFASFEDFAREWHGAKARDPEKGVYGYHRNPRAKWDWFQVGGRWTGYFKLKRGAKGELGEQGVFDTEPKPGCVDVIRKGDWDLASERDEAGAAAQVRYSKFFELLASGGHPLPPSWAEVRDAHPENVDAAREAYRAHPVVQFLKQNDAHNEWIGYNGDPGKEFACDLETYVTRAKENVGVPFAVLNDGVWHENGSMGWFGMVVDKKDSGAWASEAAKLFDGLPDDTLLMAVDCHI